MNSGRCRCKGYTFHSLQSTVWKRALEATQPGLYSTAHDWSQTKRYTTLCPIAIPPETSLAHLDLLKFIRSSCQSQTPCKTQRCSCSSANMPCTSFGVREKRIPE